MRSEIPPVTQFPCESLLLFKKYPGKDSVACASAILGYDQEKLSVVVWLCIRSPSCPTAYIP